MFCALLNQLHVALAGVVTLNTLAGDVNNVFAGIGTVLSSYAP
jgi:hypothetical protein